MAEAKSRLNCSYICIGRSGYVMKGSEKTKGTVMYPNRSRNEIANELMHFYKNNLGKGMRAIHSAEAVGKLYGQDVGNALVRGLYGTRNQRDVENDLINSGIVQLANSQTSRINNDEIKWSIQNPIKAWKVKKINDVSTQEAIEEYGTYTDTQSFGKGAQYRHIRRAYTVAKEIGENEAQHVTKIHETGNPNFDPHDPQSVAKRDMDMDANKRGIDLYRKYPHLSEDELRKKIKEDVERGKSLRDFWPKRW